MVNPFDIIGGVGSGMSEYVGAKQAQRENQQAYDEHAEDRAYLKRERNLSLQDYAMRLSQMRQKLEQGLEDNPVTRKAHAQSMIDALRTSAMSPEQMKLAVFAINAYGEGWDPPAGFFAALEKKPVVPKAKLTPFQHPGLKAGFMRESENPETGEITTGMVYPQGAPTIPMARVPAGEKTVGEKYKANKDLVNSLRVKAGKPPMTPQEELDLYTAKTTPKPKSRFVSAKDSDAVEQIDFVQTIAEQLYPIIDKIVEVAPDMTGVFGDRPASFARAFDSKWENVWYKHGIVGGDLAQMRDQYFALVGQFRLAAAQPYMKGRPSKFYLEQIGQHLPLPAGDPTSAKQRMVTIMKTLKQHRDEILRHNKIKPEEWEREGKGSDETSSTGGADEFSIQELTGSQ